MVEPDLLRGRSIRFGAGDALRRALAAALAGALLAATAGAEAPTRVFWGDTHVHSAWSFDAAAIGDVLGPEAAYRFARGEEVVSSSGQKLRLARPLDFLVVADHAEAYGAMQQLLEGSPEEIADPRVRRWREQLESGPEMRAKTVIEMAAALRSGELPAELVDPALVRSTWSRATSLAEDYDEPGRFTPLLGYEWTSHPNGGENLHRVVIFRDGKQRVDRVLPFSALESEDPEDLWSALAAYESLTGGSALAIPHNGNLSNGAMFARTDFGGGPLTRRQAAARARWEPVVEVTQQKGDSETHPLLSPNDEFADFERWDAGDLTAGRKKEPWMLEHEYARRALLLGLALGRGLGVNPFRFGMIGSSDTHTSLAGNDESSFVGIGTTVEPGPGRMAFPLFETPVATIRGWAVSASGHAGVWATENTREALFDALRRREVYASTGPRMSVRFFGGFGFEPADAARADPASVGYAKGVPMGASLPARPEGLAPSFLVAALRDPEGANLDRVQIVKGWLDAAGALHERIFDVAWSGERKPGEDGRLPPVGSSVDVARASYTNTLGSPALAATWSDPAFDPAQPAFYYARVLEIPTPRWTAYDAVRYGVSPPDENVPMTLQERAYTSPIWYEANASEARSEPTRGFASGEASEGRSPSASDQRVRGPAKNSEARSEPTRGFASGEASEGRSPSASDQRVRGPAKNSEARSHPPRGFASGEASEGRSPSASDQRVRGPAKNSEARSEPTRGFASGEASEVRLTRTPPSPACAERGSRRGCSPCR